MNLPNTSLNPDLAEKFAKCKVLVVGDIMLDRYWWGTVERISPEAPVPVVKLEQVSHTPGGAANVAANVAGLGAEAILMGTVGDDVEAELLIDILESLRIDPTYLTRTDQPTSVKTRIVAHNQHVVRVDREKNSTIHVAEESLISKSVESAVEESDIVILSDYAKGTLSDSMIKTAISAARGRGIPVLVDPKGKDFSKYTGASMITPNRKEALEACRLEDGSTDAVGVAGKQLIRDLDLDAVVITEGERGMTLFEPNNSPITLKAAAHEIYDVTGAGDTVIATLAVALAAGLSRYEAVRLANLAAGLVVEQVGTTAITIDMLTEKLADPAFVGSIMDAAQL